MSPLQKRIIVSQSAVLVGLVAVCGFALFSFWQTERDTELLNHTHKVLRQLDVTRGTLDRAKAGQRGYLLTGSEHYLSRYLQAADGCHKAVRDLAELTSGDRLQHDISQMLRIIVDQKLLDLDQKVRSYQADSSDGSGKQARGDTGHSLTEQIEANLDRIASEQQESLRKRTQRKSKSAWLAWVSFGAAISCMAFVALQITFRMVRELSRREHVEAVLRASEGQFLAFMNHTPAIAYIKDAQGRIQYVNKRLAEMWNMHPSDPIGKDPYALWPKPLADSVKQVDDAVLERGHDLQLVESVSLPSGEIRKFYSVKFRFLDYKGEPLVGGVAIDVTADQQAAEERETISAQHAALLESVGHAIFGTDQNGMCTFINARAAELLGYSRHECKGIDMDALLIHGFSVDADGNKAFSLKSVCTEGLETRGEQRFTCRGGKSFWMGYHARPLTVGSRLGGAIVTFADISDKRDAEERLAFEARHDALTGLPNRRHLYELLEHAVSACQKQGTTLSVCFCDVDNFKQVNDTHGHMAGDEVLSAFGEVLQRGMRRGDVAGRLGGDEFCVLFPQTTADQAGACIDRIREQLETMAFGIGADRPPFSVTATFGVVEMAPGMKLDGLIEAADKALYSAKRAGRNRTAVTTARQS
jgi:diguanylate cyclase (GGDEF)-like protein/PAS domain S-box-containing protein